jgi:hypothetical protein
MVALFCLSFTFLSLFLMALKLLENEQVVCSLKKTGLIWITPFVLGFFSYGFFTAHATNTPNSP